MCALCVDNCFQQLRNRHRFATLQTHVDKPVEKHERLSMKLRRSAACGALVFPVQIPPLLALLVALTGCGHRKENPVEAAVPRRVITLTPTATEMVVALGAGDRLVGLDRFSRLPEGTRELPRVGGFTDPNVEMILALAPDLVVVDRVQEAAAAVLRGAGIHTLELPMQTIADLEHGLEATGDALGLGPRARAITAGIERAIEETRARHKNGPHPVVLAVVDRDPDAMRSMVVAGPGSYIDELLAIIGASNAMAASGVRYANIGNEQILQARPEIIVESTHVAGDAPPSPWPDLPSVPALANHRIYRTNDPMFMSPSPALPEALKRLEAMIYPTPPR